MSSRSLPFLFLLFGCLIACGVTLGLCIWYIAKFTSWRQLRLITFTVALISVLLMRVDGFGEFIWAYRLPISVIALITLGTLRLATRSNAVL